MELKIDQKQIKSVVRSILDYLYEHPQARDTSRGIAEWWANASDGTTQAALDVLLEHGLLTSSQRQGQVLYARNLEFQSVEFDKVRDLLSKKT